MLLEYIRPQLTIESLDDLLMCSALEQEEFPVSVETAREACYQYLGHSTVWNEELDAFEKELRQDHSFDGIPPLNAVAKLSSTVDRLLRGDEEFVYRVKQLHLSNTEAAMKKVGISANTTFVQVLLAALVVSGKTRMKDECQEILDVTGITADDVCRIAECYEP